MEYYLIEYFSRGKFRSTTCEDVELRIQNLETWGGISKNHMKITKVIVGDGVVFMRPYRGRWVKCSQK